MIAVGCLLSTFTGSTFKKTVTAKKEIYSWISLFIPKAHHQITSFWINFFFFIKSTPFEGNLKRAAIQGIIDHTISQNVLIVKDIIF